MTSVLVDERISPAAERKLMILGFSPIKLPPSRSLPSAIASHPDTLFFKLGNELITSADYCDDAPYVFTELRERHPSLKLSFTSDAFGRKYPDDCPFNALKISGKLLARRKSISNSVIDLAKGAGYELVDVNQGYPACTTLAFENEARAFAVTADCGMAQILEKIGVNVTKTENGGISLPPYDYGFIGGASGVYKNKIYFIGNILRHPDAERITQAIRSGGFEYISLAEQELTDLGGLIFID